MSTDPWVLVQRENAVVLLAPIPWESQDAEVPSQLLARVRQFRDSSHEWRGMSCTCS
jgi:hypothetical protein